MAKPESQPKTLNGRKVDLIECHTGVRFVAKVLNAISSVDTPHKPRDVDSMEMVPGGVLASRGEEELFIPSSQLVFAKLGKE